MFTEIIAIVAASLVLGASAFHFLFKRIKNVEVKVEDLNKEKLLKEFLDDLNLEIKVFLDSYHFAICSDSFFMDNPDIVNTVSQAYGKRILRISENESYNNKISLILLGMLDKLAFKHKISCCNRELAIKKGRRDIFIEFEHGLFSVNIEIKRNDPHIKYNQKNKVVCGRYHAGDRLRLLVDANELSNNYVNESYAGTESINLFLFFEGLSLNHDLMLRDKSGFTSNNTYTKGNYLLSNFHSTELDSNLNKLLRSNERENFHIVFLNELSNKKQVIKCQNVCNYIKKLTLNEQNIMSPSDLIFPCDVDYRMILIGRHV